MHAHRYWGLFRRALAVVAVAGFFAVVSTALVVPAGAGVARPARTIAASPRRGQASVKKPKKAKKAKKVASGHGHLSKKDDVEILLLVLAPFIVTGLFLAGSGYRRQQELSPAPAPAPETEARPRRQWGRSRWRSKA